MYLIHTSRFIGRTLMCMVDKSTAIVKLILYFSNYVVCTCVVKNRICMKSVCGSCETVEQFFEF